MLGVARVTVTSRVATKGQRLAREGDIASPANQILNSTVLLPVFTVSSELPICAANVTPDNAASSFRVALVIFPIVLLGAWFVTPALHHLALTVLYARAFEHSGE